MKKIADWKMADGTKVSIHHGRDSTVEMCRKRGWKVGTRLVGDEGYGPTVIEITAIGERGILAKQISHNGVAEPHPRESNWTLEFRDWREAPSQFNAEEK